MNTDESSDDGKQSIDWSRLTPEQTLYLHWFLLGYNADMNPVQRAASESAWELAGQLNEQLDRLTDEVRRWVFRYVQQGYNEDGTPKPVAPEPDET